MKKFALIGAAGYIAPRHMEAIKKTDNNLVAAFDPNDSVGIIDTYFPEAEFFTEFERFDRHTDKLRRKNMQIDYVSVCSPNYLHDSHIRFGLRSGADVICEKPLVLNPWNIEGLLEMERETGQRVNTILQLRLHSDIQKLKNTIEQARKDDKYDVDLTYITSRGGWYMQSWKGDVSKSGGIASNIGIHFFDMLSYLFGDLVENHVHLSEDARASGYLEFKRARVRWFLSIDKQDLPKEIASRGQRTFRSITVNNEELEFSGGFTDLHLKSYEEIISGRGFGLEDNRAAISLVAAIRGAKVSRRGEQHPFTTGYNT